MDTIVINLVNLLQRSSIRKGSYGIIARQLEITRSEVLKKLKVVPKILFEGLVGHLTMPLWAIPVFFLGCRLRMIFLVP